MGRFIHVCAVLSCLLLVARPSWGGHSGSGGTNLNMYGGRDMIGHFTGDEAVNIYQATYSNIEKSQAMVTQESLDLVPSMLEKLGIRSQSDTNVVMKALKVATSWGSMQSFHYIVRELQHNNKIAVTDTTGAGIADIMYYLYIMKARDYDTADTFIKKVKIGKQKDSDIWDSVEATYLPESNQVILLDTITLRRLETVPAFREHVVSNLDKFVFAAPYAWTGGFHMFKSARTFQKYAIDLANDIIDAYRSDDCTVLGRHNFECALDRVFKDPVLERLQAAIPELTEDNVLWLKRYNPRHPLSASVTARDVYWNLRPSLPSADDLKNFAEQVRPCVQEGSSAFEKDRSVMDYISKYQRINTMPAILETVRSLMTQVLAKDGTGFDFQKVVIPEEGKSTGIVVHAIFSLYEDLNASMITYMGFRSRYIREGVGDDMRRILIVDDLALSGTQMADWALSYGRRVKGVEEVRTGALYVSPVAERLFRRNELDVYYGQILPTPPEPRTWMIEPGYKGGREMSAFPYMSPDNNFRTFLQLLAPKVTFQGKGVKWFNKNWVIPDCAKWTRADVEHQMYLLTEMERDEANKKALDAKYANTGK